MIELLVRLLRPLFVPLLKLNLSPPHLPEGSSLVRALKPTDAWLTYRYLATMFGQLSQVIGAGAMVVVIVLKLDRVGLVLASALVLIDLCIVGLSFVSARVDYELRHYLVGDRSMRVSSGAFTRREVTLSYANVQNLEVTQGPIERLFGFKSLIVTTAGARAGASPGQPSMHAVSLVGLENAEEVRELIMSMLRQHQDSGLGEAPKQHSGSLDLARLVEVRDAAFALRDACLAR